MGKPMSDRIERFRTRLTGGEPLMGTFLSLTAELVDMRLATYRGMRAEKIVSASGSKM